MVLGGGDSIEVEQGGCNFEKLTPICFPRASGRIANSSSFRKRLPENLLKPVGVVQR